MNRRDDVAAQGRLGLRWWVPYWTYHFTHHPRLTAPVFRRWLHSAARIPPGIKGVNVVQENAPVDGVPEPGGLPAASSAAQTLRALVGIWHLLRLLLWIVPYCLLVFGGVGAEALGRRLWRASDWVYDRAGIDSARRWKDGIRAR